MMKGLIKLNEKCLKTAKRLTSQLSASNAQSKADCSKAALSEQFELEGSKVVIDTG
jgi:hypothetical protein